MAQSPDEVDEIRSQIEETRSEMSETIDAIQERLSPKRVIAAAKESVTEATTEHVKRLADRANTAGERVLQYAQHHPVPSAFLATTGVGLVVRAAMRAMSTKRSNRRRYRYRTSSRGSSSRLLAAAGAGAACWLIWRAQSRGARNGQPMTSGAEPLVADLEPPFLIPDP
jgi:cell division septum initiation protein DivIVA